MMNTEMLVLRKRENDGPLTLSVVIPCYNECHLIETLLKDWSQALLELALPHELIVINDGSMDGTGRILDRLRREIKELRVLHQLNTGHSRAIRRGFEMAKGEWILQLDSNGKYEPGDFTRLWDVKESKVLVLGTRTHRLDSWIRRGFSFFLYFMAKRLFKLHLNDPAISFRLFQRQRVLPLLKQIPSDWESLGLSMSVLVHQEFPGQTEEVRVPYRKRALGKSHLKLRNFLNLASHYTMEMIHLKVKGFRLKMAPLSLKTTPSHS